jgi:hypothetical protein
MKVTLEDALSLLNKYAEERTLVRAVLGTPSVSVVRVVGTIGVSIVGGLPHLLIGKGDDESNQIEFRLSGCEFEYGDFRVASERDYGTNQFGGFLVIASRSGDTLSLFKPNVGDDRLP